MVRVRSDNQQKRAALLLARRPRERFWRTFNYSEVGFDHIWRPHYAGRTCRVQREIAPGSLEMHAVRRWGQAPRSVI
jgi:hypothetical protein